MDRRSPAICRQLVPLAGQEARAAAELDEELPFTEPVGLHHLAEGLVSWAPGQDGKRRERLVWPTNIISIIPHLPDTSGVPGRGYTEPLVMSLTT